MPHIERFSVSVDHDGKLYTGEQIVEGTRFRYQKVVFEDRTKHDSYRYLEDQTAYMNGIAKQLLVEIIKDISCGL